MTRQADEKAGLKVKVRESGGELDEVLLYVDGTCLFHLEQMDDSHWWMGVGDDKRQFVHVNLFTKKAKIGGMWESEGATPVVATQR